MPARYFDRRLYGYSVIRVQGTRRQSPQMKATPFRAQEKRIPIRTKGVNTLNDQNWLFIDVLTLCNIPLSLSIRLGALQVVHTVQFDQTITQTSFAGTTRIRSQGVIGVAPLSMAFLLFLKIFGANSTYIWRNKQSTFDRLQLQVVNIIITASITTSPRFERVFQKNFATNAAL